MRRGNLQILVSGIPPPGKSPNPRFGNFPGREGAKSSFGRLPGAGTGQILVLASSPRGEAAFSTKAI